MVLAIPHRGNYQLHIIMKEERFKQIWDAATGGPGGPECRSDESYETNGMSMRLANAINEAEENEECLALNDWTQADY